MQTLTITLALTSVLLLSGCSEETQDRTPMEAEHGHAHGAGGEKFTQLASNPELEGVTNKFFQDREEVECEFRNKKDEEKRWKICEEHVNKK